MSHLDHDSVTVTLPWHVLSDLQRAADTADVLADIVQRLKEIKTLMAADRELLAQLAADLTTLATPVQALIDSEAALRARVAELEGQAAADEAGDLAAAQDVKTAFDSLAGKFTAEPESPDVPPLPDQPAPVESGPDQPAPDQPVPDQTVTNPDGSTDTVNPTPGSE